MTTGEYTDPAVLTIGVAQGWADAETDPADIDWPTRQANALIPFEVIDGRPRSPFPGARWPRGRGQLGRWGESAMADAIVLARPGDDHTWLLLIERGQAGEEGYGTWAVPGGSIDPGETALAAGIRELEEETGLYMPGPWPVGQPRYVPDPRASDEAWAVTVPVFIELDCLHFVRASSDAARAEWVIADSMAVLQTQLAERFGGQVFAAHEQMLIDILDRGKR